MEDSKRSKLHGARGFCEKFLAWGRVLCARQLALKAGRLAGMDGYVIGAGAVLKAGAPASIAPAALHAQTDRCLAAQVGAALIDFEATDLSELSRVLIVAAGWSGPRFQAEVVQALLARRECTLAQVVAILAETTGVREVHHFAHWRLDAATTAGLERQGVRIVAHPLAAIDQAALVSGQRLVRWPAAFRAA
jgi:hypothetical protein